MKSIKSKNIKWWVGTVSYVALFSVIGIFAYIKMSFLFRGVQIVASIDHSSSSTLAEINGYAKNATYLTLNGREIFIDRDGKFKEMVSLMPGFSVVTLEAQDKFGKSAEKKFELVHEENGQVAFMEQ